MRKEEGRMRKEGFILCWGEDRPAGLVRSRKGPKYDVAVHAVRRSPHFGNVTLLGCFTGKMSELLAGALYNA